MSPSGGRVRLVVLFGGRSAEHEVSCQTAVSVLRALDPDRYEIVPIGITRRGRWVHAEQAEKVLATAGAAALPPVLAADGPALDPLLAVMAPPGAGTASAHPVPTVVFPLLHGPFGEDGTVQGLCELADVPYVGAGVLGSALAMDKAAAKEVLARAGLPQVRWLVVGDGDVGLDLAERVEAASLGWPVFVKPANLGSSVGVTKVTAAAELQDALALALSYDEWALIEEAVTGREIECGVLGGLGGHGGVPPTASVPGEVRPSREFYDYEDKYLQGAVQLVVPAALTPEVAAEVQRLALRAFAALRGEGMARVDFFFEETGRGLLVNEVNTIPGFTPMSMYPMLWAASEVPYPELLDRLVELALDRHVRRQARVGRPRSAAS
ncbi:MAG: D-alanine--D-alanine ligase family protein [Acidimicrobiales bacterium]